MTHVARLNPHTQEDGGLSATSLHLEKYCVP